MSSLAEQGLLDAVKAALVANLETYLAASVRPLSGYASLPTVKTEAITVGDLPGDPVGFPPTVSLDIAQTLTARRLGRAGDSLAPWENRLVTLQARIAVPALRPEDAVRWFSAVAEGVRYVIERHGRFHNGTTGEGCYLLAFASASTVLDRFPNAGGVIREGTLTFDAYLRVRTHYF